jgi:hypothetical protein
MMKAKELMLGQWGKPGGIPVYNISRDHVDVDRAAVLRRLPVPPGHTQSYPYIVKIAGEGEYVVNADGTATFYSYKYGRWEPPQVVDNNSMVARMFGDDR